MCYSTDSETPRRGEVFADHDSVIKLNMKNVIVEICMFCLLYLCIFHFSRL